LQAEASVSSLYLPEPQYGQVPSSSIVLPNQPWPMEQTLVVWKTQAAVETVLYVPAEHGVQIVPLVAVSVSV
jgi:hypothetical protein